MQFGIWRQFFAGRQELGNQALRIYNHELSTVRICRLRAGGSSVFAIPPTNG